MKLQFRNVDYGCEVMRMFLSIAPRDNKPENVAVRRSAIRKWFDVNPDVEVKLVAKAMGGTGERGCPKLRTVRDIQQNM